MLESVRAARTWLVAIAACGPTTGDTSTGSAGGTAAEPTTTSDTDDPGATGVAETGPPASTTDTSSTAADSGGTLPPVDCPEGEVDCGGVCVHLATHEGHCGECFHECKGDGLSKRCKNYACEPGLWPCITPDMGVSTCAEACALVDETCVDEGSCSGGMQVWTSSSGRDNNPQSQIASCMDLVGGNTSFDAACDDPIDWDFVGPQGQYVLGVACCCTQD